jgi:Rod binding domain-containing protein
MPLYVNPMANDPLRTDDVQALQQHRERVATNELEKLFASLLVKEMRKSVKEDGLFGSGPDAELYQDFMDESMTSAIADGGHFGIAKMAETQLRRDGLLPDEPKPPQLPTFSSKEFPLRGR